jgi:hypothetical protein
MDANKSTTLPGFLFNNSIQSKDLFDLMTIPIWANRQPALTVINVTPPMFVFNPTIIPQNAHPISIRSSIEGAKILLDAANEMDAAEEEDDIPLVNNPNESSETVTPSRGKKRKRSTPFSGRKRKRTKRTACDQCHDNHLSCTGRPPWFLDGGKTCSSCARRGFDCHYTFRPQKRIKK